MPRRNTWSDQHPRISIYCDSPQELATLQEEASRNGLKLADYVKHIIGSREVILRSVQRTAVTVGHGVRCYNCNNTLAWDFIKSQAEMQGLVATIAAVAPETAQGQEAAAAVRGDASV